MRLLATHSIRQVPLHFPTHASPCTITFRKQYTTNTLNTRVPTPGGSAIARRQFAGYRAVSIFINKRLLMKINKAEWYNTQSGWPRGLRRRSAAAHNAGIAGSIPAVGMDVCLLLSVVCCKVEFSATGRSLVQRSPTECGVSECDLETSTMRKPRPSGGTVEP